MMVYKIKTFDDIVKVLREQPQWLEEVRRLVLTNQLLALPEKFDKQAEQLHNLSEKFDSFVEQDFRPTKARVDKIEGDVDVLKQDVSVLKQDVSVLKQDVSVLKQDVSVLKQDVKKLKDDVAELKGDNFERKVRERAPSYFGRLMKGCKTLSVQELDQVLEQAMEKGIISERDKESALNADVVVTGLSRAQEGLNILVVCEVSVRADRRDVERAYERAGTLSKAFGLQSIPAIIAKTTTRGATSRAREIGVMLL